jgi:hypothetical protein
VGGEGGTGVGGGHIGFSAGGHTRASGGRAVSLGCVAHPARRASAASDNESATFIGADVGWVLLEVLVALAIAIAIVLWTIPRERKDKDAEKRDSGNEGR